MTERERQPLTQTRRGFQFKWWGGEYMEISVGGHTAFEVINMSPAEGNGHLPEFTREVFLATLDALDNAYFANLRAIYRESKINEPRKS